MNRLLGPLIAICALTAAPDPARPAGTVLEEPGSIAGTVTEAATGQPIPFFLLFAFTPDRSVFIQGQTDGSGRYTIDGLPAGSYFVETSDLGFQGELYDDVPCPKNVCDLADGTPVAVSPGATRPGIDFALEAVSLIEGTVTETATGDPILSAFVRVSTLEHPAVAQVRVDAAGRYAVAGLDPGYYFVTAHAPLDFVDELYDDLHCLFCDRTDGVPVEVSHGATTSGIDFALDRGGAITGSVTDTAARAVAGAGVMLHGFDGNSAGVVFADLEGHYAFLQGLPGGDYFVNTFRTGLAEEIYDDLPCPFEDCVPTSGTPVAVSLGEVTPGIDFALAPLPGPTCSPSATALCLAGDRFRVEAAWRDFTGGAGVAQGVELTPETGTFWFFDPGNVELVVKVLDGCFDPYDSFWVFAGGLTDVEVVLTVTDTATGESRTYSSGLGSPFQPIRDTAAFASCEESPQGAATPPGRAAGVVELPVSRDKPASPCDTTTLCLSAGRFAVEAFWRTLSGESGVGRAVSVSGDSGYFWFFDPGNVEVVVKVLDACGLAPFDNFWVFAAGLTDVGVTLRVTDTVSGQTRDYVKPPGSPFQPITDTGAFATCP